MKLTKQKLYKLITEEMKTTRQQLQRIVRESIILEGFPKNFTCDGMGHSNGFIFPNGVYLDLSETPYMDHDEYIEDNIDIINPGHEETPWYEEGSHLPKNLISVSNPEFWAIQHSDWSVATDAQIHGMIDCLLSCKNYTPWLKNNIETKQITFFHEGDGGMNNKMTFPDFLERYGNRNHIDRLFNEMMK